MDDWKGKGCLIIVVILGIVFAIGFFSPKSKKSQSDDSIRGNDRTTISSSVTTSNNGNVKLPELSDDSNDVLMFETNTEVEIQPETVIVKESIENIQDDEYDDAERIIQNDDLSFSSKSERHHAESSYCVLGEGEGLTITVSANDGDVYVDDILFIYDEEELNVSEKQITGYNGQECVEAYITGVKEGVFDLSIVAVYDYVLWDEGITEDLYGDSFKVKKLNATDGKTVYVTPSGEKYHFSKECAGENALDTTLYDAVIVGYDHCRKCAG